MPIDPNFQKNRKKVGKEEGLTIWGPMDPPQKLGIRGSNVAVDWDICTGCGICLSVCPAQLYDWKETAGHPSSEKKSFPAREPECACCYECEAKCSVQAIRVIFYPPKTFTTVIPLMFAQIIGSVIYGIVFGPYLGLNTPFYVGWIVSAVSLPFFFSPLLYFPKNQQEGKSVMDTTVIVERGTYGIVRHPQILGCIMLMSATILISQHWLSAIVAVPIFVLLYQYVSMEERNLIVKFGDDYKRYMQKVPRMNFVLGIIRLLRRKKAS
ncbi:MAG: 4Fe-4S binding protein [Candidatus Bathyarchaeota archaeon]|nr:MAG: 4Fe-4S binding protein [Candidatus Bathyarchaeota archaeon]